MVCLKLNWFFYDPSWMLQLSEFVWMIRSLVWVVFNNFLLIDATDRSKISSDQKRLFFAVSLYPLSFFANTLFKKELLIVPSSRKIFEYSFDFLTNGSVRRQTVTENTTFKSLNTKIPLFRLWWILISELSERYKYCDWRILRVI